MQAYLSHCRPCKHTSATAGHASIPQPLQAMQAYLSHCRPCKHTSSTAGQASIPQPLQAMQAYLSHCRPCKHTSATAGHASIPQPLQAMQAYLSHCRPCKHAALFHFQSGQSLSSRTLRSILRDLLHRLDMTLPSTTPQLADWCSNCSSTGRTPSIYHSKIRTMAQLCLHNICPPSLDTSQ